jgi:D-alanyl-D-alanine carboxypeptidase
MEEVKKATAKVVAKAAPAAKAAEEKKPEVKAAAPVKEVEAKKAEVKKAAPAAKAPAKKAEVKKAAAPAAKTAEKKAPVKKAAKVEETVNFQFSGKSYTPDDLMKIFRDVWKYDMNGREEDIRNVELYVKPEENTTYFVVNGSITGSFFI